MSIQIDDLRHLSHLGRRLAGERRPGAPPGDAPPDPASTGTFDVADPDIAVGELFRWPADRGAAAETWRVLEVLEEVDDLYRRVRAAKEGA